jgi:hypothetical protein
MNYGRKSFHANKDSGCCALHYDTMWYDQHSRITYNMKMKQFLFQQYRNHREHTVISWSAHHYIRLSKRRAGFLKQENMATGSHNNVIMHNEFHWHIFSNSMTLCTPHYSFPYAKVIKNNKFWSQLTCSGCQNSVYIKQFKPKLKMAHGTLAS